MLAPARRIALSSYKAAAPRTAITARCIKPATTHVAKRHFHKTPETAFYKALWQSMRVKIPWVDALAQSRKQSKAGEPITFQDEELAKPDLTPKRMSDSYFAATIPLAEDKWLLDEYLNASGRIRLGTLFMDLDALAGVVAYKHTGDTVATVTAAVDRITLLNPLKEICNLQLSGQVTYATGRSSMEISLQVAKAPAEGEKVKDEDVLITCAFTMVSLDPKTKKPVAVAPLLIETEEEQRLFQKGEENYNAKKALRKRSSYEQPPDQEESNMIHSMWTTQRPYKVPGTAIQHSPRIQNMDRTVLRSAMIMQPEDRNRHNFMIFGGFLLQQTFELAFCCAASFSHTRPSFVSLDPSTFENPVPVGSVLYLKATVAYTEPLVRTVNGEESSKRTPYTKVHVRVDSKVRDVEHATKNPTGVFHYTFLVPNEVQVMPTKYAEYMLWLDARRRAHDLDPIIASRFTEDETSARMDGVTE
ncbi:acyl-CoA thioester hydrolase, putative [Talaromyces stipitatus ATCC 10500]|uniref:Acyl-CoA thioester hydrolase, putative n=2 Tax=Talaromyces stipitatus (strain ATCC 10500 / CBS 375.48 / QM 6759 / NRRL 1006) TaxID=441959 RepID=B8LUJ1_TALSN|nr:acyl-CoA thioester hydrolase, putative [Talaromyces stipitatus ATCC 10500]EED23764.1 acyl-CoA thioester hydrolase, putative [Talaromyces stipitatus ATCC 10500]